MRIAAANINRDGIDISRRKIAESIYRYNGLLGRAMYKMYDLGYQGSPSVFDKDDFRAALRAEFRDDTMFLRDNTNGRIDLETPEMVKYAMYRTRNAEFKEVMGAYLDILTAQSALGAYKALSERLKEKKKQDVVHVKPMLGVSSTVSNRSALPLDNEAVWECFVLGEGERLVRVSTGEYLVEGLMRKLGYSDSEYRKHKSTGKPFFIAGVSQSEEAEVLGLVIGGYIDADGKYGKELAEHIDKYYSDFAASNTGKVACLKFEEQLFLDTLERRIGALADERGKIKQEWREFYVTPLEVVFAVKDNVAYSQWSPIYNGKLKVGSFVLNYENCGEFSKANNLLGLCGEFVSERAVIENGWFAEGLPVHMLEVSGRKGVSEGMAKYYPVHSVYYGEGLSTVRPVVGRKAQVSVMEVQDAYRKAGVSSKTDLYAKCVGLVEADAPEGVGKYAYAGLVADMAVALVMSECGESEYDVCGWGYGWVTADIFRRAAADAEVVFRLLSLDK